MSTQRSNIEVFFRVLGSERVRRAMREVGQAGLDTSRRLAGVGTGMGSALAAANARAIELGRTLTFVGAIGLGALAKGIKTTTDSSAELTSIVLALRAINGEIAQAKGQPLFRAAADGTLRDVNAGGARQSADDLQFVQRVADEAGKSIRDLAGQYVQLNASATKVGVPLRDVRSLFTGVSNAAVVLGVDAQATARAFTALSQIASKGVVASEELRGQLAEALPGAVPLAAKAYGMSVQKFMEAVGSGQVDASTFIARFGKALNDEYAGAAEKASNTTRVALGRLANAFFLAKVSVGNGALDDEFRRIINSATALFRLLNANGAFTRFGANLAAAIRPLSDRFERAVNGGYDFEKVLNRIAGAVRALVNSFLVIVSVMMRVGAGLSNLRRVFELYGVRAPRIGDGLIRIADGFRQITEAILTRRFTGNGYLDFFVSLYALVEASVYAIAKLVSPKVGPGITSMERAFAAIAYWLNQAAAAIVSLASGQISPALDENGQGILENMILAIDRVRQLIALIKTAWALMSGEGAPQGADLGTQRMFAKRDAVGDLLSGGENKARANEAGEMLYDPAELDTLFEIRDIIVNIANFIWDNRGILAAWFDGALAAIEIVSTALAALSEILDPITKALGFEDFGKAIAYALGFWFIMGRVLGVLKLIGVAFAFIKTGQIALGVGLALTIPQFLVIAAVVAGIAYIIGKIVSNWGLLRDEIGNVITLIGAGLTDAIAEAIRGLGYLLSLGGKIGRVERAFNGFADKLNEGTEAARKEAYYKSIESASERQKANGGVDPFADGEKSAFDFLGDAGLSKIFSDFGSGQDETNKTLEQIAAQGAANDNGVSDADMRQAMEGFEASGGAGFSKPVVIYLSNGKQVELRGRESDSATFESLAAETVNNRAGTTPGWGR